ncbi:hypothetical protein RN001_002853 [Aquatica leii]|uniref:Uncharacterized protein n=1 Tax=Aquatica leii TaxID=1421715 RepID=A0AAN7Q900_9COLE|nr:hypothetical protein RN001_002853 [Aquatica leii]
MDVIVAEAVPHLYFVDNSVFDSDNIAVFQPLDIAVDQPQIPQVFKHQSSGSSSFSNSAIVQDKHLVKSKRVNNNRVMSAYEEEMLALNNKKFKQAMQHAEELHTQKIKNEQELHDLKMFYEKLLYEKKLKE